MKSVLEIKSDSMSVDTPRSVTEGMDSVMPQRGMMDLEPNWKANSLKKVI